MTPIVRSSLPQLDLHGEDREGARIKVIEFIRDQYSLGNKEMIIIHGIGQGILRKEVHKVLKQNKLVEEFNLDNFNLGMTYVRITYRH